MSDSGRVKSICVFLVLVGFLWAAPVRAGFSDPTRPPTASSRTTHRGSRSHRHRRWRLSSTVVSPGRRIAVINGTAIEEGQTVDGARLVEVLPHAATLRRGRRTFTIRLSAERVKAPVGVAMKK